MNEEMNNSASLVEDALNSITQSELTDEEREMLNEATGAVTTEDNVEVPDNPDDFPLSQEDKELLEKTLAEVHQEIPVNSTTALIHETTSRFSSAIWYQKIQEQIIMLAGVGGIGSYVAFLLARMKPKTLFIYDDDIVESANMSGQLYGQNDIGHAKVSAISEMIKNYADFYDIFAVGDRYTKDHEATKIMICGFDNMEARKTYYYNWKKFVGGLDDAGKKECLFIDGRLSAEEFQVFAIQGTDERAMKDYEANQLFKDSEADGVICSYKQTTFCANMIGSIMVNIFVNFIANQCEPLMERDVPYLTEYTAETMFFKTTA